MKRAIGEAICQILQRFDCSPGLILETRRWAEGLVDRTCLKRSDFKMINLTLRALLDRNADRDLLRCIKCWGENLDDRQVFSMLQEYLDTGTVTREPSVLERQQYQRTQLVEDEHQA